MRINDSYEPQFLEVAEQFELCRKDLLNGPRRDGQPKPMKKKREGSDVMRMRFLPPVGNLGPVKFWGDWCHYAVSAGLHPTFPFDRNRRFEWEISFFHSPGNLNCRKGFYEKQVTRILQDTEKKRPTEFFVVRRGDPGPRGYNRKRGWPYIHIYKRYYIDQFPVFSPRRIADDLAWLVKETYPKFTAL
jgi:hypothetical protein